MIGVLPRRLAAVLIASALVAAGVVVIAAPPAAATSITVNTVQDIAPDPTTGRYPTDGKCSLRAAIHSAQSNSNADDVDCATGLGGGVLDTIHIDPSLAGQKLTLSYAPHGVQPFDDIIGTDNPIEIIGPTTNAADFVIDANDAVRPFDVGVGDFEAGDLKLANLTVRGGNGHANGGSVFAPDDRGGAFFLGLHSHLTLDNVAVRDNHVECGPAGQGGAIYGIAPSITNNGGAYVDNGVVCPGYAYLTGAGGAIFVEQGPWTLDGYAVLFQGNSALQGGVIATNPGSDSALVHLERSLLRGNVAEQGGVLHIDSSQSGTVFELYDSTAYANSSVFWSVANTQRFDYRRDTFVDTGEVFRTGGGVMANTIVTGSSSCTSTGINAFTGSRNLLDAGTGKCGQLALLHSLGAVTGLAPSLAQNGGPQVQQTFALQPGSNAIDDGDQAYCGQVDARSVARGIEGDGMVDSPQVGDCDIGSYEYAKAVVNFVTGTSSVSEAAGTVTIPVRLRLLDPDLTSLTSPLVVDVAEGAGSTASVGPDPKLDDLDIVGSSVTFPAGSHDGAVASVVVHVHQDDVAEAQGERALLDLVPGGTPGVAIAEPKQHELSIQDDDQAGVVVADGGDGTTVAEATPTVGDTVTVRLQSQPDRIDPADPASPGADVAMSIQPDRDCTVEVDGRTGSVSQAATTTIRNADWATPHVVTVRAVDDLFDEDLRDETATHTCHLRFTFTSPDPVYDHTQDAYDVTVQDNDVAGVTVTKVGGPDTLAEGSATGAVYAVRLDTPPNPGKPPAALPGPTRVVVTPTAGCDVGSGPGAARAFAFDDATWDVPQTFTLVAVDDQRVDLTRSCDVVTTVQSPDPIYANLDDPPAWSHTPPRFTAQITDYDPPAVTDDPPFVVVDTAGGVAVDEHASGTPDSLTVRLLRAPVGGPVAVTLDSPIDPATGGRQVLLSSGAAPAGSVTLTFDATTWSTPQRVGVRAVDDAFDEDDPHLAPIIVTMSSIARGFDDPTLRQVVVDGVATPNSGTVVASVADDDTSAVDLVESGGSTQVVEGGAPDTIGVRLATHPYAPVSITLSAGPRCTVDGSSSVTMDVPASSWDVATDVTVAAVDDLDLEGPTACTITASATSADARYQGLSSQIVATVVDDEVPQVVVTTGDPAHLLHVAEQGATSDSLDVVLASRPSADVTVTAASADGRTTSTAVTFTPQTWDQPRQLDVRAVDDRVDQPDGLLAQVTVQVASSAVGYATAPQVLVDGVSTRSVGVEVADDDTAGLVVSPTALSLAEGGAPQTVSVTLATQPVQPVHVDVTATGLCTVAPSRVDLDAGSWDQPHQVVVTPDEDQAVHPQECAIHLALASTDPRYDGLSVDTAGPVADDDHTGVLVTPTELSLTEVDPSATAAYSVVLTSRPLSDVSVTLTPQGNVTVPGGALVFTPAAWDVPQTVTVAVADDSAVEPSPYQARITHQAHSTDPAYDAVAIANVDVAITDNDSAVTVTTTPDPSNDGAHTVAHVVVTGGGRTSTGPVWIELDGVGAPGTRVDLVDGTVALDLGVLPPGAHAIHAAYGGDAVHEGAVGDTTVVVTAVPRPADDVITVAEDSGGTQVDVLANDSDADGDVLGVVSATQPSHGTVSCSATSCVYAPARDYHGQDWFTYVVTDGALTASATVAVTVTPVDDAPVLRSLTLRALSGAATHLDLLARATDVDGDALSVLSHSAPQHGTVVCHTAGGCTYTSAPGYTGPDSFDYTVTDGPVSSALTATASALSVRAASVSAVAMTTTATVRITVVPAAGSTAGAGAGAGGGTQGLAGTGSTAGAIWPAGLALLGLGAALLLASAADRRRTWRRG